MLTATRPPVGPAHGPDGLLTDVLQRAAVDHPDVVAVVDEGHRLTHAELWDAAVAMAAGLRELGVSPGDPVVLQLPNWWETVVAVWGVLLAGGVVVPVVPIYRRHELELIVGQVRPAAVVAAAEWRRRALAAELASVVATAAVDSTVVAVRGDAPGAVPLRRLLERAPASRSPHRHAGAHQDPPGGPVSGDPAPGDPDAIAVVLYTSGTTAQPKGVLHSHRTLLAEVASVAEWCDLDGTDRVFMASPLSHVTGLAYGVLLPAHLGTGVVLQDRWDPDRAAALVDTQGCTFTVAATPFLRGLTDTHQQRGRSNLRIFVCGGADVPAELVRRAIRVLGTRVVRTYGSSELPTSTMADPFGDVLAAADGDGLPMGSNEIRLDRSLPIDGDGGSGDDGDGTGELQVRGPELFLGYVDAGLNEEAFTDDGFFRTGDLATIDQGGALRIVGRVKDIVNRGGEKLSAAEIEEVLLTHPAVTDVAVVGSPDPILGERVCAWVVPAAGRQVDLDALRRHVTDAGLALQKAPERLELVDELPRTASGKLQRYVLRDRLRTEAPSGEAPGGASGEESSGVSREAPGGLSGEAPGGASGEAPGGASGEAPEEASGAMTSGARGTVDAAAPGDGGTGPANRELGVRRLRRAGQ